MRKRIDLQRAALRRLLVTNGFIVLGLAAALSTQAAVWSDLEFGVRGHIEGRTYTTDPFSVDYDPNAVAALWACRTSVGAPRGEATDVWFFADLATGTLSALSASASAFCPASECGVPNWSTYFARSSAWVQLKDTITFTLPPGDYPAGVAVALEGYLAGYVGSHGDTGSAASTSYSLSFRNLDGSGISTASSSCILVRAGEAQPVFEPFVLSFELLPAGTTVAGQALTVDTLAEFNFGGACPVAATAASIHVQGLASAETVPGIRVETLSVSDARVSWQSASGVFLGQDFVDTDGDGLPDTGDNCLAVDNPRQRDTDGDSIGNACDADFNNDCAVNFLDLAIMKSVFFSGDPEADLDGDGSVNFVDLGIMKAAFFLPPGPSGLPNDCARTAL